MRMMIRYQSGLRVEAVLLAANRDRMRVAIETQCDTIELHRVDAGWRTQRGAAIEIEALIALRGARTHACRAEPDSSRCCGGPGTPFGWHGLACR